MAADASLPHLILAQAAATPEAVAVRCRGAALSYRALHLRASALAARLRQLGVQRESTVAVLAARSTETIIAILAIHYAGGAYVPLDPEYPREVLAFTLVDCGAAVVLGAPDDLASLPPHQLTTVTLDGSEESDAALAEIAPCEPRSLGYVLYTSGSTGRPKGVLVTHGALAHSTHARHHAYSHPPQRFLLLSSFAFDSSVAGLFWTLSTGGTLVLSTGEERDPAALTALIAVEKITHTLCLPSLYLRLLAEPRHPRAASFDSLRCVIVAGEACPPSLPAAHEARLPQAALFNEYGPTEATVWSTFARLTAAAPITIGQPIHGATIRLLDEKGSPAPDGEPGEIHIAGPGVARGYLNRADLTAERFVEIAGERLYKTGDLARRTPGGDLEFLGRLDRQVKLRGYRIELEAIESILQSVRGVGAAAVIVREDAPGEPRLVAYVAPAACAIPTLRTLLAERLPAFMQPAAFVALETLPLTPNGKVDRRALPAPGRERPALDTAFAPPRDALESRLAAAWSAALHLDRVGIHDRFLDLGGDSLRAATLCAQLGQEFGEPIFVVAIFEAPTVARLAAYLRQRHAAAVARLLGEETRELAAVERRIDIAHPAASDDAIALVGMAGRFPGARDVATFWENLCAGVESIRPFTDEELRASGIDPATVAEPGYVNRGAQIDDADRFAASFFGYTPREAELMDPQQRVFLECAWEAFEHAGWDVSRHPGAIGVFAGLALNDYFQFHLVPREDIAPQLGTYALTLGNEKDFIATRVAFKLGLRGPAIGVQTACSTSLVALHLACASLRRGECDAALVGGGRIAVPLHAGYRYVDGGIPSPDGRCRAFDAQARGCVPSSGIAVVVVKRLADALRDGDRIYSVIRGTAINNDGGRKAGFTAPSVEGQADVIAAAHRAAGVAADTIGYVETHGTGTSLGDPIEVAALTRAFRETTDAAGFCRVGSVKTNIGHLDTGAGAAGLIKAALALDRGAIPPSLHFTEPNPHIDFARSPFLVNAALTPWPRSAAPRRAGVSSFGIGGTNAHAVLEEPPLVESAPPSCPWQLLVLSARTRRALEDATARLALHLRRHPGLPLADVAHTLQTGRRAFEHRRFVVARDIAEAERFLRKRDPRRVYSTGVARGGAPLPPAARHEPASDLEALGNRWLAGEDIDWSALHAGERRLRVPLPTYPFERERHWLDRRASVASAHSISSSDSVSERTAPHPLEALRAFLHGMSGVPVEKMTPETTLLDLGFDSLFLTQVALALRKKFGIAVTFRQLFEELSTIGALAEAVTLASPPVRSAATPASAEIGARPAPKSPPTGGTPVSQHGPFRPIQKDAAAELTDAQREHLAALTARYTARTARSKALTQRHRAHLADPRTVSGFRPYWKELTYPIVIERSAGARMWDADGHEYLDFTMGFGTNLLGHTPAFLSEAIAAQLARGVEIGPQSPLAGEVARMLCEASGLDRAAFTNTGSEAVLAAVRVARTVTGRTRIATFSGYHGINDEFLIKGKTIDGQRRSMPIAPGIPEHIAEGVLALDYGAEESLALLRRHAHELAAVLVEPVQSRHPDLQPREFLHEVRRICEAAGVALVFDEVITGFRCHPGGAQAWFDVRADLVTYGKVIGGGLPMGALCGRREFMDALDGGAWQFGDDSRPEAGVTFFAGTFVRHPLAMAASHAMLTHLRRDAGALQETLNERTAKLARELNAFLEDARAPIHCEHFASMFLVKFADGFDFGAVLFFLLREKGIHAWDNRLFFVSTAHTDADLAHFARIFRLCVEEMAAWFGAPPSSRGIPDADGASRSDRMPYGDGGAPTLPLTPSQRGLYALAARSADASRSYNEASALELRGALDVPRLETALQALVARHEALRTSIAPDGETQTVHPHAALTLPIIECPDAAAVAAQVAAVRALRFDLARAPILDARLLRLAPGRHVLLVTLHHLFCNGPSLDALFEEIFALYEGHPLPPAMQLRDFVRRRARPGTIAAESFWKMQFAQPAPPLDLPSDRPRPAVKTHAGGRATLTIDPALTTALRRAGAKHGASLFMTLLSAWQALLHRLSGQDDIVVGVPFEGSDRGEPGGDRLIANTTNVAPLRSRLAPESTFAELLAANRRLVLEASEHQDYFFGDLVSALRLPFDASRAPLFNVLFNYETGRFQRALDGLTAELVNDREPWLGLRDTAIFELYLNVTEHEGALHCRVDFNRDLFDAATVARWLAHLRTLLDAVAADPSQPVARLPLLNALERRQLLVEWNATALDWPRTATLHSLFEETAGRQPDACAILDHGRRVSYRELDARAESFAGRLRSLGIGRGQFVGVCMARGAGLIAALLGVLKSGAAYVPLDPAYPAERLALMLEDSGATVVLTDRATAATHAPRHPHARWIHGGEAPSPRGRTPAAADPARPDDIAYLIYTSGSTGRPKGVALEHRNAVAFVHWARQTFSAEEFAGVLASTSICFDLSVFEIFATLAAGGGIVLAENVLALPTLPDAASVTLVNTVPSAIAELIRDWDLPPGVRTVNLAGEPLPEPLVAAVCRRGAVRRVLDLYGPTETTTYSTFTERRAGAPATIGRPIANTAIHILDAQLQPAPIGVTGEIYIGGAGVARGYWARPELTAERFIENPFAEDGGRLYRTGDIGHWRADGEIVYLGRADRQVKVRGHRIELGEIETALAQLPAIREAAAIAATEADGEVRIVAYLVADGDAPSTPSLREALRQRLPEFMIPSAFVALDALPRTANGKLDRRALPAADAPRLEAELLEPRDDEERRVAEIWRQVLKVPRVGVNENFFDLGGHSLAAMQVASRLREATRAEVNFLDVFERPTVAALAEAIRGARTEEGVL